jgi:ribosomal-protein-alanine N-acetyltransferase
MQSFLQTALSRSVQTVWLEVRASNAAAIEFYNSFGFSQVSRRKNFYAAPVEDALVMAANLTSEA